MISQVIATDWSLDKRVQERHYQLFLHNVHHARQFVWTNFKIVKNIIRTEY